MTLLDLDHDVLGSSRPHEGLRLLVGSANELLYRGLEFTDIVEHAPTYAFARDLSEPSLDQVEPRTAGGREMQDKARMIGQPGFDVLVVVRPVIVNHQMEVEIAWELAIEQAKELEELLVTVASETLPDNPAVKHAHRGEECGRSVALVVVGHRAAPSLLHGQSSLGPVERLNLALFVNAQNDSLIRWIEVQARHIGQLLHEPFVIRELKCLDPVRLEPVRVPNPLHSSRTYPLSPGHGATAPVGGRRRCRVQCRFHDLGDLCCRDRRPSASTFGNLCQAVDSLRLIPLAPEDNGLAAHTHLLRDAAIGDSPRGQKHGLGLHGRALRRFGSADPGGKGAVIVGSDGQRSSWSIHTSA